MKKKVYEEIAEAKRNRAETLKDLRENLAKSEENLQKAKDEEKNALAAGKVDAYTKAKEAGRTAEDQIEFYKLQIKSIESAALFENPAERKAKENEIRTSFEKMKEANLKEAAQLISKADALVEAVRAEIGAANDALTAVAIDKSKVGRIDIFSLSGLSRSIKLALTHGDISQFIN